MYNYLKYKIKYLKLKGGAAAAATAVEDDCTGLLGCQCSSCAGCTGEPDYPCFRCS